MRCDPLGVLLPPAAARVPNEGPPVAGVDDAGAVVDGAMGIGKAGGGGAAGDVAPPPPPAAAVG